MYTMATKKKTSMIQVVLVILFLLFLSISVVIIAEPSKLLRYTQYWILCATAFLCMQSIRMALLAAWRRYTVLIFMFYNIALFVIPLIGVFNPVIFESFWKSFYAGITLLIGFDLLLLNKLISGNFKAKLSDLFLMVSFLILLTSSINIQFQLFTPFDSKTYLILASFISFSILLKLIKGKSIKQG